MVWRWPRSLPKPGSPYVAGAGPDAVSEFLSRMVETTLGRLQDAGCLEVRLPCVPLQVVSVQVVPVPQAHRPQADAGCPFSWCGPPACPAGRHARLNPTPNLGLGPCQVEEGSGQVVPLPMGRIASYYYMRHQVGWPALWNERWRLPGSGCCAVERGVRALWSTNAAPWSVGCW